MLALSCAQPTHAVFEKLVEAAAPFARALVSADISQASGFMIGLNFSNPETGLPVSSISVPQGCEWNDPLPLSFNCYYSPTQFIAAFGAMAFQILVANYTAKGPMPVVAMNTTSATFYTRYNTNFQGVNSTWVFQWATNGDENMPQPACSDPTTVPTCISGVPACQNPANGKVSDITPTCTQPDGGPFGVTSCLTDDILVCNLDPTQSGMQTHYYGVQTKEGAEAYGQVFVIYQDLK